MVSFGDELDPSETHTLWDSPWPSEELRALFNMVPDRRLVISWVQGLSVFTIRRYGESDSCWQIYAHDGFNYEMWAAALQAALKEE